MSLWQVKNCRWLKTNDLKPKKAFAFLWAQRCIEMEKQQVENAVNLLESGDSVGITVFADQAIPLQSVLSREDYKNSVIRNLRYIDSDFVRYHVRQGTDYGVLILTALGQFGESGTKILFILTDGEPQGNEEKLRENLSMALEEFSKRKM